MRLIATPDGVGPDGAPAVSPHGMQCTNFSEDLFRVQVNASRQGKARPRYRPDPSEVHAAWETLAKKGRKPSYVSGRRTRMCVRCLRSRLPQQAHREAAAPA